MCAKGSIRICLALAFLTCLYFSTSSGLYATEESRSACFDAEADPSIRTDACTQIIDAPGTLELVRLSAYLNRAAARLQVEVIETVADNCSWSWRRRYRIAKM